MELTFRRPDEAAGLSAGNRARRVRENDDLCVIDGKRFSIRALLPLPVRSREFPYSIGIWVEVAQSIFTRIYDHWDSNDQMLEPNFAATVANEIPAASGSLGLRAALRLTGPTTRPNVLLEPSSHRLYVEQAHGMDEHRASEYSARFAYVV